MSAFLNTIQRIDRGMLKSEKTCNNREPVCKKLEHITLTQYLFPFRIEIPHHGNELPLQRT